MGYRTRARSWHNGEVFFRRSSVRAAVLWTAVGLATPVLSQTPILFPDPYPVFVAAETELLVPPIEISTGWIELTALVGDAAATVIRLGDRKLEDGELLLRPGLPPGPAMLCSGGAPFAVTCEQIYAERGLVAETTPLTAVDVRFEDGLEVAGRYLLDSLPVAGARVAVVPATYGVEVVDAILDRFDSVVLLKVKPVMDALIDLFERRDLLEHAVFVNKVGTAEESVVHDLTRLRGQRLDYLSLVLVKNPHRIKEAVIRGCRAKGGTPEVGP